MSSSLHDQDVAKASSYPVSTVPVVGGALVDDSLEQADMFEQVGVSEQMDALRHAFRKTLVKLSYKDKLTKLYNRRYFDKAIKKLWNSQQASEQCLSLILCDVDYLKDYNDVYGYQSGDQVLRYIANTLLEQCKDLHDSVVTRYEEDCFAMLVPNALIDEALVHTEDILAAIKALAIPNLASDISDVVTASFGIASVYPRLGLNIDDFFAKAKEALGEAKMQGRNAAYTLPPAWSQDLHGHKICKL